MNFLQVSSGFDIDQTYQLIMKLPNSLNHIYIQVLIAVVIAIIFGSLFPNQAVAMKPLGDGFIKLVKMVVVPLIFCTIVSGIIYSHDMKEVAKIGVKALIYFEILTTVALIIGVVVAYVMKPGFGMNVEVANLDKSQLSSYVTTSQNYSMISFLYDLIPNNIFEPLIKGEILPTLFIAILFSAALVSIRDRVKVIVPKDKIYTINMIIDEFSAILLRILSIIIKLAPIGAFGAMSYTVGKQGIGSLLYLLQLIGCFYLTCILFILLVLGLVLKICGSSIIKLIKHIKEEIFLVIGTSSSEAALPSLIKKMEDFGCPKSIVGLVIPAGYSFNLDGSCIYFTMATIFIAQACNIDLSLIQMLTIIGALLITSKGAAGVTGSGFITLVATLSLINTVPIVGLTLILGIDRFMSEARALTNLIGNATAAVVISRIESRKAN